MINLLSTDQLRNVLETLRIGKAIELLWRESTSTEFDEEIRLDMFNKCIKKRLELTIPHLASTTEITEEKVIKSRKTNQQFMSINLEKPKQSMGRYNSFQEENGEVGSGRYRSQEGGNVWDIDEFGDMDQYEKMMLMKSFKKKKEPQKSLNSRYGNDSGDEEENQFQANFEKKPQYGDYGGNTFDPQAREMRRQESLCLIQIVARLVLNMIKHQSKRNEIAGSILKKHKDIGYQMLRKSMKSFELEVNREDEVELFVERFCPEEVIMALEEFKQGGRL